MERNEIGAMMRYQCTILLALIGVLSATASLAGGASGGKSRQIREGRVTKLSAAQRLGRCVRGSNGNTVRKNVVQATAGAVGSAGEGATPGKSARSVSVFATGALISMRSLTPLLLLTLVAAFTSVTSLLAGPADAVAHHMREGGEITLTASKINAKKIR